jgi:hypothetical protein
LRCLRPSQHQLVRLDVEANDCSRRDNFCEIGRYRTWTAAPVQEGHPPPHMREKKCRMGNRTAITEEAGGGRVVTN